MGSNRTRAAQAKRRAFRYLWPVGTLMTLRSFNSSDGAYPSSGVTQGSDGSFYGTTVGGGATGSGTIFKIDAAGTLTTLHHFNYRQRSSIPLTTPRTWI